MSLLLLFGGAIAATPAEPSVIEAFASYAPQVDAFAAYETAIEGFAKYEDQIDALASGGEG